MLFIFGLLLLLIPTCVEMFCRFNQTDPCYAALGHKLYLQMVMDARDQDLELYKWIDNGKEKVFRVKNNKEKKNESIRNRSEFIFNNGTLIINSVIRTDSGTYTLELYNSTGTQTHAVNLTVIVEVSAVATSLIVLGSIAVILILLFITAYHFYKKKQLKPTAAAVVGVGTETVDSQITHKKLNREDEQKGLELPQAVDVEYAVVSSHTPARKEKKRKMNEEEVQYGDLTFTPTVSNNQHQYQKQEDCVYSQINAH